MEFNDRQHGYSAKARGAASVRYANQIVMKRIEEFERTRRLVIILAALLAMVALLVLAFAPTENRLISSFIAAALLLCSLIVGGIKAFRVKLPGIEVETNEPYFNNEGPSGRPKKLAVREETL